MTHYGHATGDLVLSRFAKTIAKAIRPTDVLARLGGEEFAVLFPASETVAGPRRRHARRNTSRRSGSHRESAARWRPPMWICLARPTKLSTPPSGTAVTGFISWVEPPSPRNILAFRRLARRGGVWLFAVCCAHHGVSAYCDTAGIADASAFQRGISK
jgi:hypothetical protein